MSSFPTRLIKRSLLKRGFSREWVKPKHADREMAGRVLNADGNPVAHTWAQAAQVSA